MLKLKKSFVDAASLLSNRFSRHPLDEVRSDKLVGKPGG
jgi:hypothetical protein